MDEARLHDLAWEGRRLPVGAVLHSAKLANGSRVEVSVDDLLELVELALEEWRHSFDLDGYADATADAVSEGYNIALNEIQAGRLDFSLFSLPQLKALIAKATERVNQFRPVEDVDTKGRT